MQLNFFDFRRPCSDPILVLVPVYRKKAKWKCSLEYFRENFAKNCSLLAEKDEEKLRNIECFRENENFCENYFDKPLQNLFE
jgi:hypothetical protein